MHTLILMLDHSFHQGDALWQGQLYVAFGVRKGSFRLFTNFVRLRKFKCKFKSIIVSIVTQRTAEDRCFVQVMFVLKGLGRFIWGDPDKTEIVQIASGQLYLVRPKNSVKGTSECMYVSV